MQIEAPILKTKPTRILYVIFSLGPMKDLLYTPFKQTDYITSF